MGQLRQVLIAMAEMHQYDTDPDMLADLQLQVADSYTKTPKLRLVWLEKLAELHIESQNWSEAGMCVCHCAALITEYLKSKKNTMVKLGRVSLLCFYGSHIFVASCANQIIVDMCLTLNNFTFLF